MKKFLCMMMAVLMVLAMAACGGEPANNGGNDTPDATTVKIGGIGPLTGAYANYGLSEKNGAELAVKEINEAGGIAGKQVELSYQDSQGDSESARQRLRQADGLGHGGFPRLRSLRRECLRCSGSPR